MPLGQSQDISQADPGGRVSPRFWHRLIRFRHFIGGSLALASLNLACRDHVPTFPQRSPPSLLTTAAWRFRDPFAADRVGGGSWDSAAAVPGAGPAMLLVPGLALEAIPGLGVLPFWLLVVGAIAVLGTPTRSSHRRLGWRTAGRCTPRPNFERH
jgi:hypothetical protein